MSSLIKKRSFFERLTGSVRMEDDEPVAVSPKKNLIRSRYSEFEDDGSDIEEASIEIVAKEEAPEEVEAQLAVDMYETNNEIVIKTMTAGVKKEDLTITISRDELTIRGKRDNEPRAYQHTYHEQELYWGSFARTITLPDEVDVDQASASEYHGLITIKLPKFDKKRKTTLKIS